MKWIEASLGVLPKPARVGLGLLTIYLLWGSTFLAIRLAVEAVPPFLVSGARWIVAGSALYAMARLAGAPRPSLRAWGLAAGLSLPMIALSNGVVTWAETRVASGLAAVCIATVATWMVLVDWLRPRGRRPTPLVGLGLVLGIAGVAVLADPSGDSDPVAIVALVLAALAFATGSVLSRHVVSGTPPMLFSAMQMLVGGGLLVAVAAARGDFAEVRLVAVPEAAWLAIAWLAVAGSIVGYNVYGWLVRNASPALVGTYACANPIVALALGAAVAHEPLTARMAAASALVLGSVALTVLGQSTRVAPRVEARVAGAVAR